VAASGFGIALAWVIPWWVSHARAGSDDKPGPRRGDDEGRPREPANAEPEAGDEGLGPDLDAFWRGDDASISTIYRAHVRRLLNLARTMVGPAEAESVVQEVFVELIRAADLRRRFTGGSLAAWLGAIARLKSLEHLRRRGPAPRGADARGGAGQTKAAADARPQPSPEPQIELWLSNRGAPP